MGERRDVFGELCFCLLTSKFTWSLLDLSFAPPYGKLSAALGQIRTVAGSGRQGYQDGPAQQAKFNWPSAAVSTPDGTIYVADTCTLGFCFVFDSWIFRGLAFSTRASFLFDWVGDFVKLP